MKLAILVCIFGALGGAGLLLVELVAKKCLARVDRWLDVTAEVWTAPDGTEYDLTVSYLDADGDTWTPIGWLVPFDGVPIPYLECKKLATDIEDVIGAFGPLTPDLQDAE